MIKDITIGQYFPGNSFIHKLDPRAKLIITVLFIVIIFMCKNFLSLALMFGLLTISIAISKVPFKMFFKSLKPIVPIVIFTSILNIFYVTGGTVLFSWNFITISTKGLLTALFMAIRIVTLIISSSLLTYTTTPTMLTDGLERLLSPLNKLHIQVHTLAMIMTLALRFIPTLIEEVDKIMNAQKARGADLESGNIIQRAKALVPILVPLFVSSIRRAYELAFAMECRCYSGGEGRTRMKKMKFGLKEAATVMLVAVSVVGVVLINNFFGKII